MSAINAVPLTVSLVQTTTHWHDPQVNHRMFENLFDQVPDDSRLIVLPEMFSTGFTMASAEIAQTMQGATITWMRDQAMRLAKFICGSVVITESGKYFNRFVWVDPQGEVVTYDKRHLFRMAGEHQHYSAGGNKIVLQLDGWRICPMVCYDLRFPTWFRNRSDYDVLICVANWPAARQLAWQTLLRARALENQAYMVGVNIVGMDGNHVEYAGGSAVYAPDGEALVETPDQACVVTQSVSFERLVSLRENFPVWQDADEFELLE